MPEPGSLLTEHGLSMTDMRVWFVIEALCTAKRWTPITAASIATHVRRDTPVVYLSLKRLEGKGWLLKRCGKRGSLPHKPPNEYRLAE